MGDSEKMLLADIHSFGDKGFYKSNETIGKEYMASERTVSRWIANILKGGFVHVKNPKGYHRTFWAKSHPEVRAAVKLWYRNKKIPKTDCKPHRHNCPTKLDKNSQVSKTKPVSGLSHNCPPTNKRLKHKPKKKSSAADLPLPAGGQASQLLTDRTTEAIASVEQLKKRFGSGGQRRVGLSTAEIESRRQRQKKALFAGQPSNKGENEENKKN